MAVIFSLEDNFEFDENTGSHEAARSTNSKPLGRRREDIRIFDEKLGVPGFDHLIARPRLNDLLERSMARFNASLICGRAGTGKSAAAASYAVNYDNTAWYALESSDTDWNLFSRYFSTALYKATPGRKKPPGEVFPGDPNEEEIAEFLGTLFSRVERRGKGERILVVVDNLHHIFDANWFGDFFTQLLFSLLPKMHLLLLCRSKPPLPLFRLRSKQVLNVIDEKLIVFNQEETDELCSLYGRPKSYAKKIQGDSFGRISKIIRLVNQS
jgi:LuxR family maltose regulon positive regulatory protein